MHAELNNRRDTTPATGEVTLRIPSPVTAAFLSVDPATRPPGGAALADTMVPSPQGTSPVDLCPLGAQTGPVPLLPAAPGPGSSLLDRQHTGRIVGGALPNPFFPAAERDSSADLSPRAAAAVAEALGPTVHAIAAEPGPMAVGRALQVCLLQDLTCAFPANLLMETAKFLRFHPQTVAWALAGLAADEAERCITALLRFEAGFGAAARSRMICRLGLHLLNEGDLRSLRQLCDWDDGWLLPQVETLAAQMQFCGATAPIQSAVIDLLRVALERLPSPQADAAMVALCRAFHAHSLWPAIRQLHREAPRSRKPLRDLVGV